MKIQNIYYCDEGTDEDPTPVHRCNQNEPEPQQKDLVIEARAVLTTCAPTGKITNGADAYLFDMKAPELLRQLADEVERLREQWNTRFNTLCGNCGQRYLGPRDEHLHGFGKCEYRP